MTQELAFLCEGCAFARVGLRSFELRQLKTRQLEPVPALVALVLQQQDTLDLLEPSAAQLTVARQGFLQSSEGIEQPQLLACFEQPLVVVLTVNLEKPPGQLAQGALGDGSVIDVGPAAPLAGNRAA